IHTLVAKAIDNSLAVTTSVPRTVYVTQAVSQGLKAEYFANRFLSAPLAFTRIDSQVNFTTTTGWVGSGGVGTSQFSVRWSGQVYVTNSGTYTFYTNSDDGVRLSVDGQQVVDNWTDHSPTENSGTIALTAGQLYPLTMEYFQGGGGGQAQLSYAGPGVPKQLIPTARLYPASAPIILTQPTGLTREQGTDAVFTVLASGLNNRYEWRLNGVAIPGADGTSLTVREVIPGSAGQYSVLVSNSEGFAVTNNATLNVTFTDTDHDGLQDAWEQAQFGSLLAAATQDADGDGRTNREEFLAGTDPKNGSDFLKIEMDANPAGSGVVLSFTAKSQKTYTVLYKNNLNDPTWLKLQDIRAEPGDRTIGVTDASAANGRFYKVVTPLQ
ncbi:MAG: hypothetical protein EOP84_10005, partial [Verrucomicrobiaceae bacterium]